MDLVKNFVNIGFIIFCLLVLLFMFNYEPQQAQSRTARLTPTISSQPTASEPAIHEPIAEVRKEPEPKKEVAPSNGVYLQGVKYGKKRFQKDGLWGTYKGPMKNGKPHGFGVFKYERGDMYVGQYRDGMRDGFGHSIYKSGKIQLREYHNSKKVQGVDEPKLKRGKKAFKRENSNGTYEGPMKGGVPHGFGAYYYGDGRIYVGKYNNGARVGEGNLLLADGSVRKE